MMWSRRRGVGHRQVGDQGEGDVSGHTDEHSWDDLAGDRSISLLEDVRRSVVSSGISFWVDAEFAEFVF